MADQEKQPLLREASTSNSVRFSQASEGGEESFNGGGKSSSSSMPLFRTSSSLSDVFKKFAQSDRDRALEKAGVGGAAFLIHDAVLGDSNASVGE